jgi:acetyl esterase
VLFRVARGALALPPRWQRRLSGGGPVCIDGLTLDPQLQLLLMLHERIGSTPLEKLTPAEHRARRRRDAAGATGRPIPVRAVSDVTVDGGDGQLRGRHYIPDQPGGPSPLLLYLHGGGFVVGDLDTHDQACRMLCRYAGVHVVSVDYRLAPEHPFPAATEDSHAALRWAFGNAARLGADPARVAVGGDSAGGNLAAVAAQAAKLGGDPVPALQLLIYPAIDRTTPYPSLELFGTGFFLTRDEMDWFDRTYAGVVADRADPRLCPLRGADLSGLAPALVVTAGFDPLRDEGEAYASALAAAGTQVTLLRKPTMIHGFINMIDLSSSARAAFLDVARKVRAMLGG